MAETTIPDPVAGRLARLAWRVAEGADPATVCALTFNRAAAVELQERADGALAEAGHPAGTVRVRTFHALGRAILIDAGVDVTRIVERPAVLARIAGGPLPPAQLRHLDDAFTRLKLDPERGPPPGDAEAHAAFAAYGHHLRSIGAIDLDDLVALAGPALQRNADLLRRWRERAAVLFVDEAQDLDKSQLDLALLLAGDRRDIFLVGDDDQTSPAIHGGSRYWNKRRSADKAVRDQCNWTRHAQQAQRRVEVRNAVLRSMRGLVPEASGRV